MKEENKVKFTKCSNSSPFIFVDSAASLEKKEKHLMVLSTLENTCYKFWYKGMKDKKEKENGLIFWTDDSRVPYINVCEYLKINEMLKEDKIKFNKKTCDIIKI